MGVPSPVGGVGGQKQAGAHAAHVCTGPQRERESPGGNVDCAGVRPTWVRVPALPRDL